jgi:hypothetical protein
MPPATVIEARGDGWVVGDDDEDTPPTVFPSAEAAYRAWERVEKAWAARTQRREEALKRLGKKSR